MVFLAERVGGTTQDLPRHQTDDTLGLGSSSLMMLTGFQRHMNSLSHVANWISAAYDLTQQKSRHNFLSELS